MGTEGTTGLQWSGGNHMWQRCPKDHGEQELPLEVEFSVKGFMRESGMSGFLSCGQKDSDLAAKNTP